MKRTNKTRIHLLFILGIFLAQSAIFFTEFKHPLHAPDTHCDICLAVHHITGGALYVPPETVTPTLEIFQFHVSLGMPATTPFFAYTSRAPPVV